MVARHQDRAGHRSRGPDPIPDGRGCRARSRTPRDHGRSCRPPRRPRPRTARAARPPRPHRATATTTRHRPPHAQGPGPAASRGRAGHALVAARAHHGRIGSRTARTGLPRRAPPLRGGVRAGRIRLRRRRPGGQARRRTGHRGQPLRCSCPAAPSRRPRRRKGPGAVRWPPPADHAGHLVPRRRPGAARPRRARPRRHAHGCDVRLRSRILAVVPRSSPVRPPLPGGADGLAGGGTGHDGGRAADPVGQGRGERIGRAGRSRLCGDRREPRTGALASHRSARRAHDDVRRDRHCRGRPPGPPHLVRGGLPTGSGRGDGRDGVLLLELLDVRVPASVLEVLELAWWTAVGLALTISLGPGPAALAAAAGFVALIERLAARTAAPPYFSWPAAASSPVWLWRSPSRGGRSPP